MKHVSVTFEILCLKYTSNISLLLLVEETKIPRENHRPAASHRQTLSHTVVLS